jgi:parallel beta-helix repeat protein
MQLSFTPLLNQAFTLVASIVFAVSCQAATYYVSPQGNDADNGSISSPWKTVQKGAAIAEGGDTVIVGDGQYDEYITINGSGINEASRIVFQSQNLHGAKCMGFRIQGNYITIDGFTIEADLAAEYGIYVNSHHHVTVKNCYILECPGGGINFTGGSSYCTASGNILEHNGQWGIHVVGSYAQVEDNEIFKTVQHHPKIAYTGFHGEDADGLRIFGNNHLIRGNYLHDLGNAEDPGNHQGAPDYPADDYPHVDCLQSWDRSSHGGRPVITDSVIENNYCSLSRASGKGIMISAIDNGCNNLTIMNNIFEYRDIGIVMNEGTFSNIFIYNNVFKANLNDPSWGAAVYLKNITNYQVLNNIMVDGHAEARKIVGGTGTVDYNLVWYSDGSTPAGTPGPNANELWGVDPRFFSYSGENGGNYRLKSGSDGINTGTTTAVVQFDKDGNTRPKEGYYDIGAYEHDTSVPKYTLTYAAGAYGSLSGVTQQTVLHGMNGATVTALPYRGYAFLKWSDGLETNPRQDTNVTDDVNVTALYRKSFYWNLFFPAIHQSSKQSDERILGDSDF